MKKISNVMRGVSSVTASVLALSVLGTGIANSYRKNLDEQLGTTSYVTSTDEAFGEGEIVEVLQQGYKYGEQVPAHESRRFV